MNNPLLSPEATLLYIPTADGHKIPVRHWPVSQPRAIIHIVHGMAEHSGSYDEVAAFLNQQGFAVLAHDHRCHGLSTPEKLLGQVSKIQNWAGILQDMSLIHNWISATYNNLPVIILAHSMGSFISQWFVQNNPNRIKALALSGSNFTAPWFARASSRLAAFEMCRQGGNGHSDLIHSLGFGKFNKVFAPNRTDFDWLSRDTHFVDSYIADPFCGFRMANRYWRDFMVTLGEISQPANMKKITEGLPLYIFSGSEDPVGAMGKGVKKLAKMHAKINKANVTLKIYPQARHVALHETNATEVRNDLLAWLLTVVPNA
jgi:alpha-beta hydrolase superfamily lysophospholipase